MRGMSISRSFRRAMYSGLPPSRMSVPRPAMLVEMVTALTRPLWATISASRCTFSGLALSTSWVMPFSVRSADSVSLCSTEVVPTSTGRPFLFIRATSVTTAFHFAVLRRNTTSGESMRELGRLVGTT